MSGFILLASYPKSGSTWLRAVLESLRNDGAAVDINGNLAGTIAAADRRLFDRHMGVKASDLSAVEIAQARPQLWRLVADRARTSSSTSPRPLPWIKVHDALLAPLAEADAPFPLDMIAGVVHIVRDPRDVVVSFAHHFRASLDEAIAWMDNAEAVLDRPGTGLPEQLPQLLSRWSRHVESWLDAPRSHLVRYEDMHANPEQVFAGVADFLGLASAPDVLTRAIAAARFDVLQAQEHRAGFKEREPHMDRFFRRGIAGGWRETLSPAQAARIVQDHSAVMARLGYLQ